MRDDHAATADGATRWWILAFVSAMMFGNYYVYDAIGPLADTLQRSLGFSDTQIGALNAIYSLPNVFMVLIGGLLVDRFGAGRVALWTTGICLLGACLTAARGDFVTMAAGRLLFGIGAETMIVAITAALAMWFRSSHLALAMALNVSIARGGSYAADVSPVWAGSLYEQGWQAPLLLAAGMAAISFVAAVLYWNREHKGVPPALAADGAPDRIVWRDVLRFDRSYWYVVALCVLFYSVIFPFRSTFAIKYFQHAHDLPLEDAATINSYVFLAAVFVTPAFGALVDRVGRRALFMVFGSLLLPLSFLILITTDWGLWVTTVLLGISFSLIPAVLWPAVALVVPAGRLGTAYGLMTMIQNIGLGSANLVAGRLNDAAGASAANPEGYLPMLVFFGGLALLGFVFAVLLRLRETSPHGHGLETSTHTEPKPVAGPV
jgi:MFS family permease